MEEQYFYGTGRRKTAVARVRLLPGKGAIVINGTPYEELFTRTEYRKAITKPPRPSITHVAGSGISNMTGAIMPSTDKLSE